MGTGTILRGTARRWLPQIHNRTFTQSWVLKSGHNRWSKIRHDKAKADSGKSKLRTYLAQDIILASKYGGPDPKLNPKLAFAIASAKKGQLSKTSIDSAIAKGQGRSLSGATLENVTIEALLPHGVAVIMECQTDNKARVLQEIRLIINKAGGTVTPTAFLFDKKGKVWFEPQDGLGFDTAMDEAIEAGAEDIVMEDGKLLVDTPPDAVTAVAQHLSTKLGLKVEKTEILYEAKEESLVSLDEAQESEVQNVLSLIEQEEDLQNLYVNASA